MAEKVISPQAGAGEANTMMIMMIMMTMMMTMMLTMITMISPPGACKGGSLNPEEDQDYSMRNPDPE